MLGKMIEKQFLPTKEDVNDKEVEKLSKRFKGYSDKEILTNVLEWQEKNIQYWNDRGNTFLFLLLYLFLITSILLLPIQANIKWGVVGIFILFGFFDLILTLSYILPLIASIIALFTWTYSINFSVANKILPVGSLVILSIILGSLISLLLYLRLKYRNLKSIQPEFKLRDTFKLSLSVDKILKYRLAICRDYAKLTAALLLNIYRENKLYFITIPNHVATAIQIGNKKYVLDQRLPVTSLEKWKHYWKERFSGNIWFLIQSFILRIFKGGEVEILEIIHEQDNIRTKKR